MAIVEGRNGLMAKVRIRAEDLVPTKVPALTIVRTAADGTEEEETFMGYVWDEGVPGVEQAEALAAWNEGLPPDWEPGSPDPRSTARMRRNMENVLLTLVPELADSQARMLKDDALFEVLYTLKFFKRRQEVAGEAPLSGSPTTSSTTSGAAPSTPESVPEQPSPSTTATSSRRSRPATGSTR